MCAPFHFHTSFTTYIHFIPGAYLFFKVQFFSTKMNFVTIWISFKTLLPNGITGPNDELFAVLPQSTLSPAVRHKINSWMLGLFSIYTYV